MSQPKTEFWVSRILCPFGLQWFWRLRFSTAFFSLFFFGCSAHNSWLCQLWTVHPCTVYGSHKLHFLSTFLLKMSPTALFTPLKIISLQCFQFQFSVLAKIIIIKGWVISRISSHHFYFYFYQLTCDIAIYLRIYVGQIRFVTIQELIDKVGTFKQAIDKFGGFLISWICIKYFGGFKNMVLQ